MLYQMSLSPQSVQVAEVDLGFEGPLFENAILDMEPTLSEQPRRATKAHSDASSLIAALESLCQRDGEERGRVKACKDKFELFVTPFEAFFHLLSLRTEVKVEWPDHLWQLVELVFQAASDYVLFLEKIADMFMTIARNLPPYQQFYEASKGAQPNKRQSHNDQAATVMSYVYADIVHFCLDLCHVFSRDGSPGVALRHLHLSPPTISWRPLDSRFARLVSGFALHRKWSDGEFTNQEHDPATIASRRSYHIGQVHQRPDGGVDDEELRMAKRMRRVDKVKTWLSNTCSYRDMYEYRLQQRYPNSCTWFLQSNEYSRWRNAPFEQATVNNATDLERTWQDRMLFVQAKPGFGKSYISGAVIDELSVEADNLNIDDDFEPPTVAYFHFNATHSYCLHPNDAFRALAFQLVHSHRHDRSTLDAISLLVRKTSPDARASSDDVLTLLSLLLHQHPTFLVVDGLDECSDVQLFLETLPEVCRRSDTRTLLFSRPEIVIPRVYQRWASDSPHIFTLGEGSNAHDIQAYLGGNLNRMADQGFFGINMDRSLIYQVPSLANSMFLWASLLLKYLQSPGFTPDERQTILQNVGQLDGLEPLYQHILDMLGSRPEPEKSMVVALFRWVSLSINRMCMQGLQRAIAIVPGQRTKELPPLSRFLDSVGPLTCGLIEVTQCSVVFTHPSIAEYLQSPAFQSSPFSLFDESISHAHLAARCLSFLAYDMPKMPLARQRPRIRSAPISYAASSGFSMRTVRSGDSGYKSMSSASGSDGFLSPVPSTPSLVPSNPMPLVPEFDADLPFLRYASLCWPIHLTRALSDSSYSVTNRRASKSFALTPYLPSLSAFLTDRSAVTAWIEASWRYNLPPNLSRLVPLLSNLKTSIPPGTIEGREIRWVVQGLRELSTALNELKGEFGTTLRDNPGLVWQWRGAGGTALSERVESEGTRERKLV